MSKQIYYRHEVTELVNIALANLVGTVLFSGSIMDAAKIDTIKGAYMLASAIDEETLEREKEEE